MADFTFTADEITTIITHKLNHDNFNVKSYEVKLLDKNLGLCGTHASLKIVITLLSEEQEVNLFCKFFPTHEGPALFAKETGMFKKEIFVYKLFAKITNNSLLNDSVPLLNDSNPLLNDCVPLLNDSNLLLNNSEPLINNSIRLSNDSNPLLNNSNPLLSDSNPLLNDSNPLLKVSVPLLNDCIGNCYYVKENHVIVMEDLKELGYQTEGTKINDLKRLYVIVNSLAKIHASSLIYEENVTKKLGKPYRLIDDILVNFEESFFNKKDGFINKAGVDASIKAVITEIDLFHHPKFLRNGKEFKTVAKESCYRIYDLVKPSNKYRNVISHGDLWSNNFLIKYDRLSNLPIECKFVDFQCTRYVPPSQDLLSLIYLTTTRDFREKYMYEIIGYYYATLEKYLKLYGYNLNNLINFDSFLQSCEEQKLFAIVQTATYFQLILIDPITLEELFKDKELYDKTFLEDRSLLVLSYINNDDNYKKRLEESIEDLKEYCEK